MIEKEIMQDLHRAMQRLGLNPTEQEVVDIPNQIARKGLIYFPDFCQVILERFRQSSAEEEDFRQMIFKVNLVFTQILSILTR